LAVHGIQSVVTNLTVNPNPNPVQMLVRNWTLPAGNVVQPMQNCTANGSIPSQGGGTSQQTFDDHAILEVPIFDAVVDPSYGLGPYWGATKFTQHEMALLSGTVTNFHQTAQNTGTGTVTPAGNGQVIHSAGN
jgi:hypothetical protein